MGLVSAAVVPISHIVIRTFIMNHFSVDDAGYWQGLNRLSDAYLSVILLPLSVYYLPRLSEIHSFSLLKKELSITFLFSVPLAVCASALVYLFRDWIILLLFTSDFSAMRILFPYQLIGNVIKVGSWTIAMLMWAKSMTRLFIFTEIFFSSTLILFSIYFLKSHTLVGVTYAYLLNQVLYFLFLIYYFRRNIREII
jgi:PST family polysaccharide transporter